MPIRLKVAAVSTVAVLVLLLGAGLFFLTTLRAGLQNSLDNSLRSRVEELTAQLNDDGSLRTSSTSGLSITLADNTYGQVLSADGRPLRSTTNTAASDIATQALLDDAQLAQAKQGKRFFNVTARPVSGGRSQDLRVLAEPIGVGPAFAAVGTSRDVVDEAMDRAGKQLLVLGAVVIMVAAPGSWLLAREALKPVDRMRAQAAELQAHDAEGGLTVPQTRDEINRLAATLNALLARLHSALERERAFVADAGHELRTPLTVLRGELELARRPGRSKADLEQAIAIAAEETERLIRLSENLLVLARDESTSELRWADFDVVALVAAACARFNVTGSVAGVRFQVIGPPSLVAAGDPDRIRQAVDNVLANAMRFSGRGTVVDVGIAESRGSVSITVADRGPGFAEDLLPIAFERFVRGGTARTRARFEDPSPAGSGLGLAIVRSSLRSHGGDAIVANRTDSAGALVTLTWPVHRESSVRRG